MLFAVYKIHIYEISSEIKQLLQFQSTYFNQNGIFLKNFVEFEVYSGDM